MGNCWSEVKTRRLAAELDSRIKQGSLDDVKALLSRGAPVNGTPEQVDATCIDYVIINLSTTVCNTIYSAIIMLSNSVWYGLPVMLTIRVHVRAGIFSVISSYFDENK